jgi:hypothetical protein
MATKQEIEKNTKTSQKLLEFALSTSYGIKNSMKVEISSVDLDFDWGGSRDDMQLEIVTVFIECNSENGDLLEPNDVIFELRKMEKTINDIMANPVIQFRKDGSLGRVPKNDISEAMIYNMKVDLEEFNVTWNLMVHL